MNFTNTNKKSVDMKAGASNAPEILQGRTHKELVINTTYQLRVFSGLYTNHKRGIKS